MRFWAHVERGLTVQYWNEKYFEHTTQRIKKYTFYISYLSGFLNKIGALLTFSLVEVCQYSSLGGNETRGL